MRERADRTLAVPVAVRLALVVFVLAWLFGPYAFRNAIPVWLPFLVALGLEVHFFLAPRRGGEASERDAGPQAADRELYGYGAAAEADELLLLREEGRQLWIPYAGETDEELEALVEEARERPEASVAASEPVRRERQRPWRGLLVGLAVIGALAVLVRVVEDRTGWDALSGDTRVEAAQRFSLEASRLADKPVTIRCDESGDYVGAVQHADGVATLGGELAFLTPQRCLDLYRLAFEDEVRASRTGRAIAVLAHEVWHLRGVRDEGITECYGLQSGVELGRRLGLSEGRARQLMRQQLTENRLRSGSSFEYRVPAECRDGGRLDLDPSRDSFP